MTFIIGLFLPVAKADEKLAQKLYCLNCHAVYQKKLGPAFFSVAEKYRQNTDILQIEKSGSISNQNYILMQNRIMFGSKNNWGIVPMPGNAKVTQNQAELLTKWILNLPQNSQEK